MKASSTTAALRAPENCTHKRWVRHEQSLPLVAVAALVAKVGRLERRTARETGKGVLTRAGETTPRPLIRLSGGSAPRYLKRGSTAAGVSDFARML